MNYLISLGILFALGAALSSGVEKILRRHVAVKVDVMVYAFLFNAIASLIMLPFFIRDFVMPSSGLAWALWIIPSFLFAGTTFFMITGYKYVEASVAAPLTRLKVLIVLIISIIFLNEILSLTKVAGTLIVFFGLIFLSSKKSGKVIDFKNIGLYALVLSVTFTAVGHVIEKAGLNYIPLGMYAFSVYFVPMLIFLPFFISKKTSFKEIYKNRFWALAITAILSATYHFLILNAFKFAEASVVIPVTEMSNIIAVIGGIVLLHEREHIPKKVIAMIILIIGAVLVSLG